MSLFKRKKFYEKIQISTVVKTCTVLIRLTIRIADSVSHALHTFLIHITDSIASAAANAHDLDDALHLILHLTEKRNDIFTHSHTFSFWVQNYKMFAILPNLHKPCDENPFHITLKLSPI